MPSWSKAAVAYSHPDEGAISSRCEICDERPAGTTANELGWLLSQLSSPEGRPMMPGPVVPGVTLDGP